MSKFFFIFIVVAIIFEITTKKKLMKAQISEGPEWKRRILSEEPLTANEKILTWICCIFNPIIAGAILYYGWRKRLPTKAKQANRISWVAFLIDSIFFGSWYITIRPN